MKIQNFFPPFWKKWVAFRCCHACGKWFFFFVFLINDVVSIDIYGEVKSVLICGKTFNVLNWITRYKLLIIAHNIVAWLLKLFASFTYQKRKKKSVASFTHILGICIAICGKWLLFFIIFFNTFFWVRMLLQLILMEKSECAHKWKDI